MSEASTDVEVPEVEVGADALDVEVVSDVVEQEVTGEEAPTPKRTRRRNANGEADVQQVAAPAPVEEKSSFTRAKASKLTDRMKASVQTAGEMFIEAYQGRIWLALDYPSWGDYLNGELGELRPRLPKSQRLELVGSMKREAKMSQTAIAEALGVDQKTVSNDLKELRGGESDASDTSVGQDGVERSSGDRSGRRKPLVDRAGTQFDRLDKVIGDLTELMGEEEWDTELGAIASRYRPDVARAIGFLRALQETLDTAPEFEEPVAAQE